MTRTFALVLAFIALTLTGACAPTVAPAGLTPQTPAIAGDVFVTRDGLKLPLRHWDAPHPIAIIVALHGMSDYSNAFAMPAPYWARRGISTYAYDQRGFGAAPNRGVWPGSRALRHDLDDAVAAVRAAHPGIPVYALGESMGGAVVLTALASAHPPAVDGAILVAPAVWSRTDMPLSYRVALWLVAHTLPQIELSGSGLNIWPSDNIPMLRRLSRDPLFEHKTRADAVYGLVNLMDAARKAPGHLASPPPILLLHGERDQIIPKEATDAVIAALGNRVEVRRYMFGYHMLLRDIEGPIAWNDIVDWINERRAPHA